MLRLMRPPSSTPELAASGSLFPVEGLGEGEAGLTVSSRAGAAVTSDWADNRRGRHVQQVRERARVVRAQPQPQPPHAQGELGAPSTRGWERRPGFAPPTNNISKISKQLRTAALCRVAKAAVFAGGRVRSMYVQRRRTATHCKRGTNGIRCSKPSWSSKRCCNLASTNSRQPTRLPRTTTPLFSAGSVQLPVQQGLAGSSGGNMSSSPGGCSPALFQARVFPRCTWMLACCWRESWRIRNWSAVRSGCPVT